VFGFQDPNQHRDDYQHSSVEGLAALYVDALREFQPEGPYHLLGWSFGGHVAFEMACCLERQGAKVERLALLDTWAPSQVRLRESATDTASLLEVICRDLELNVRREQLDGLSLDAQIDFIIEMGNQAKMEYHVDPRRFLRRNMRIFRARLRATWDYHPGVYSGPITLFRAADDDGDPPPSADLKTFGWGDLTSRGVDAYDIPGTHVTVARAPNVQALADRLVPLLRLSIGAYVA